MRYREKNFCGLERDADLIPSCEFRDSEIWSEMDFEKRVLASSSLDFFFLDLIPSFHALSDSIGCYFTIGARCSRVRGTIFEGVGGHCYWLWISERAQHMKLRLQPRAYKYYYFFILS